MTPQEIKDIRKSLGWTGKQLAEKLGVAHNTVRRWECGANEPTSTALTLLRQLDAKVRRKKLAV